MKAFPCWVTGPKQSPNVPSIGLKPLCLSSETSSQFEAEGSKVYLPMDGLKKDAMVLKLGKVSRN